MREMVDQLNVWAYEYYVLDAPTVSDTTFDALYDRLVTEEKLTKEVLPDSPTRRVGGETLKGFVKHTHKKRLYSLDKVQSFNELETWINKVKADCGETVFTVELKYDGLTVNVTYKDGQFVRATTRGNGIEGEDITAQALTIKSIPMTIDFKGEVELQGEGIMRLSVLDRYNKSHSASEQLKSARNAAAGALRNLNPKITAERNLDVVFYSNGYCDRLMVGSQTELVDFLTTNKFKTNDVFERATTFDAIKEIIERIGRERPNYDFLIDGVVIKIDDYNVRETLGFTDKFPRWAVAFKFDAEQVITELVSVEWQIGRTGKLTPLGHLEAVELCGATIKRATLNNFGDITRKNLSTGSLVYVRRSNDVIPEVLGLAEMSPRSKIINKPSICPACGSELIEI
ncbi:MAG: NAD-dependent DNA ligase LigA, partial [Clostridia bacterium]